MKTANQKKDASPRLLTNGPQDEPTHDDIALAPTRSGSSKVALNIRKSLSGYWPRTNCGRVAKATWLPGISRFGVANHRGMP